MLRIYNTLTRQKEEFSPLQAGKVRLYSCGPTVYDYAHIGNFRSFILADLLKRYLCYRGFEVFHVMNITDVEDKILRRLQEMAIPLEELTGKYVEIFFTELDALNVVRADLYPRATEHVEDMVQLICRLVEKGLAYERGGSVYFSISKFPDYGKLARLDVSGMQDGISVDADEYDRDHVRDFVLWKARGESDGEVFWDSPFGQGRPGWHLECSCMSMKYLGETFDIHTGGVDLIFPHHQNEIAQSEGATDKPFVRYWVHNEFLNVDDEKMSKSLDNFYRLQDIARAPEDIKAYRYMLVVNHYRNKMNFTFEALDAARNNLRRLSRLRERLGSVQAEGEGEGWEEQIGQARSLFHEHLDDDLNTPRAMAAVFEVVNRAEGALNQEVMDRQGSGVVLAFLEEINQVLGVFYRVEGETEKPTELPEELTRLIKEREEARARKDWAVADQLRDQLVAAGVEVKDTPSGTEWSWIE